MLANIVVPVDGSEPAKCSVAWASAFAKRTGARLAYCSVVDPMLACVAAAGGALIDPQPMLEALADDARRFCSVALTRSTADGVAATTTVLEGTPAAAIVEFVRAQGADCIVLGTHGRHGLALGVLGSVTDVVVRTSPVPVIVLRAQTVFSATGPIAVAIDDSAASARAAQVALEMARALGVGLHLMHVATGDGADVPEAARTVERAANADGLATAVEVRRGAAAVALLAGARECGAMLLATGTHGRVGLGRLLLGSVAERLIRGADMPVLVVRPMVGLGTGHVPATPAALVVS
jgi:nucleotide-binding universal stress UspA family protein